MTSRQSSGTVILLSLMMALVPALGVPNEELIQDTLKSILVSFSALVAALFFFWNLRKKNSIVHWHGLMWLPLALMTYALISTTWSHAYLGSVETIRWFIFSLILFLGANSITHARVTHVAWGIHLGAVIASLWAALQFWTDFSYFAQGPNPASTFVNRNFFGEFVICTIPFSVFLLTRLKDKTSVFLLTFSLGFNITCLMMTGTRSALLGLLLLIVLLPVIIYLSRKQFESSKWTMVNIIAVVALLLFTIFSIGSINSANPKVIAETGQSDALDRAFKRTTSMANSSEYSHGSFSVRTTMWKATTRMIVANSMFGVGAGAWEVQIPFYQEKGSILETDFYAHNEILQLLAEYGLVGWFFLIALFSYLLWAAFITWSDQTREGERELPLRAFALASLVVLLLVSNAGFPWRMATTGALFALNLSILAASDIRLGLARGAMRKSMQCTPRQADVGLLAMVVCVAIATYITQQAIVCESKLVRAVKIALTISQSGRPNDPGWGNAKSEMLQLANEGISINPHYRKLTPIVADNLAKWGDWKNASWIWESTLESRPNIFAVVANLIRANLQSGDLVKAQEYIIHANRLHPSAPDVAALEVMLWSRTGKTREAAMQAKKLLQAGFIDPDLVRTAYFLGMSTIDPELAILALELRIKTWPDQASDGWLKLGQIYDSPQAFDNNKALQAFRAALENSDPAHKSSTLEKIPQKYHNRI